MPDTDAIKQAVKEALTDKRLDDLATQMTDLATQMTAGFTAVHTRQDIANGKLLKHEGKFEKLDTTGSYDKLVWLLVTSLVAVVVYFVTKGHV